MHCLVGTVWSWTRTSMNFQYLSFWIAPIPKGQNNGLPEAAIFVSRTKKIPLIPHAPSTQHCGVKGLYKSGQILPGSILNVIKISHPKYKDLKPSGLESKWIFRFITMGLKPLLLFSNSSSLKWAFLILTVSKNLSSFEFRTKEKVGFWNLDW